MFLTVKGVPDKLISAPYLLTQCANEALKYFKSFQIMNAKQGL